MTWTPGDQSQVSRFFGLRPSGRWGPGWRGRRESDPQVFCHPNQVHLLTCIDRDMRQVPRPHHNHHNHQSTQVKGNHNNSVWPSFPLSLAVAMGERAGAAARRQLHHSVNRVERDEALRRQTTRESEEEEVHELSDCPRAQQRPPPGRCSSEEPPLLGVQSLEDAPAEAIDGRTLRFLLKQNFRRRRRSRRGGRSGRTRSSTSWKPSWKRCWPSPRTAALPSGCPAPRGHHGAL